VAFDRPRLPLRAWERVYQHRLCADAISWHAPLCTVHDTMQTVTSRPADHEIIDWVPFRISYQHIAPLWACTNKKT
jgi:hypothetical protein